MSEVMGVTFHWGHRLHQLQAPPAVQAYYSMYPDRLFERANVSHGVATQRPPFAASYPPCAWTLLTQVGV
jgi:hypothetical protein